MHGTGGIKLGPRLSDAESLTGRLKLKPSTLGGSVLKCRHCMPRAMSGRLITPLAEPGLDSGS